LDGSIKKNTSFVKKIKGGITNSNIESLKKDLSSLKVEKYLEEIAVSIGEGTYKTTSDLWAAVELSSLLHCLFPDFKKLLVDVVMKSFSGLLNASTTEGKEESQRLTKQKSNLRFLTELYLVGMLEDGPKEKDWVIPGLLAALFANDKQHHNVSLGATFAKFYSVYFLPTPMCQGLNSEQTELRSDLVAEAIREKTYKFLTIYFKTVSNRLQKENQKMVRMEKSLAENMVVPGSNETLEKLQKAFEKLLAQAQILATYTFSEMPELQVAEAENVFVISVSETKKEDIDVGIWEDEEQKSFYETLVDLANQVPLVLLGGKPSVESIPAEEVLDVMEDIKENEEAVEETDLDGDDVFEEEPTTNLEMSKEDGEEDPSSTNNQHLLQDIFSKMLNALNRDAIDALAVEFAFLNKKGSRKQLIQALLALPRHRVELIPYYSRMIATLNKYMPDIGSTVVESLRSSFYYHQKKKNQLFTEEKVKNIRYLAELTKFRVTPLNVILRCLKQLLDHFYFHNIDLTCALLESCGRFLYSLPETNAMMTKVLEILVRKKSIGNFDSKYVFMIENAIYATNPPNITVSKPKKERPPLEQFIRKLMYQDLRRSTTEQILKVLRKLNWDEPSIRLVLQKVFCKIWKVKYSNIHLVTAMLAELSRFYPEFGILVVDHTMEIIRYGLETNLFKWNQKRISCIKYLGELYNYRMVDTALLFDTLYLLARFGHMNGLPLKSQPCPIDRPNDFFRLRLICTLLDTCGSCFKKGSGAKKLDQFLVFLQVYLWSKEPMPMDVEFFYTESLEWVRPGYVPFATFEECALEWNRIVSQTVVDEDEDVEKDDAVPNIRDEEGQEEEEEWEEESEGEVAEDPVMEAKATQEDANPEPEEEELDEQFEKEVFRMVQESLESRRGEKKAGGFDAPIPTRRQDSSQPGTEKGRISFSLMTKKGTKQQVTALDLVKANLCATR
jgi:regulator of nonsense transcripts 2